MSAEPVLCHRDGDEDRNTHLQHSVTYPSGGDEARSGLGPLRPGPELQKLEG